MSLILPVVEGDGDFFAVPELIRRVAYEAGHFDIRVLRPHKRGELPKVLKRFEDYLRAAALENAPILWVLDYDCATCDQVDRDLAHLQSRAEAVKPAQPVAFALMVKEYESLFLADAETTRAAFPDIAAEQEFPDDPEAIRDAKGWLSNARPKGLAYKATSHQMKLTSQLDLQRLRDRSPSFLRFEAALKSLLQPYPDQSPSEEAIT
jgi:hypothetical protein